MTLEEILQWLGSRDCRLTVEWHGSEIEITLDVRRLGKESKQGSVRLPCRDWDNPNKRAGYFLSAIETIMRQIDENA